MFGSKEVAWKQWDNMLYMCPLRNGLAKSSNKKARRRKDSRGLGMMNQAQLRKGEMGTTWRHIQQCSHPKFHPLQDCNQGILWARVMDWAVNIERMSLPFICVIMLHIPPES